MENFLLIFILEVLVVLHMFVIMTSQRITSTPEVVFVCFLVIHYKKGWRFYDMKNKNLLCKVM